MNLDQAKLLARMANHIKTIPECKTTNGNSYIDRPDVPACLVCNSIRAGILTKAQDDEVKRKHIWGIDHPEGFAPFFGCTYLEAQTVIFHGAGGRTNGDNYYRAVKELLSEYGYSHLLESEITPDDDQPFTDWFNRVIKKEPLEETMKRVTENMAGFVSK